MAKEKGTNDAKRGRPATMGERIQLGLRVTKETKQSLNRASYLSGRSQSQEAEFRLEQSFQATRTLFDALDLAYGRHWTGIVLALAYAAHITGTRAMAINHWEFYTAEEWVLDPFAYDQAVKAINTVLEAFRPNGEIKVVPVSDFAQLAVGTYERIGEEFARGILEKIGNQNDGSPEAEVIQAIAQRLADLLPATDNNSNTSTKPVRKRPGDRSSRTA
ncbi:MAG TPA: TraY domain-containing protein [Rhizomicrobium sp.]|jgi:hypothetical protein